MKNPIRKQYDAVVIGTALGGLISGALLARRGWQILVVNQEQIPLTFPQQGFSIQRDAVTAQGFKRYLFETIFEELGIRSHERQLFERSQPVFQVIQKNHRLDVSAEREPLLEEYRREFPKAIDSIIKFYQAIDEFSAKSPNLFSRETLKTPLKKSKDLLSLPTSRRNKPLMDLFQSCTLPEDFQKNLIAQIIFLSHLHTETPTLGQAAQVLAETHRKDYYFLGDAQGLAQIFYDRITEAGGAIRDDSFVEKLHIKNNQVSGARLNTYEGVVEAGTYIGNIEIHRLYDLLEPSKKLKATRVNLEKTQPHFAKYAFFLGVEESVLPMGMRNHLVLIEDNQKPLVGENFILLKVFPPQADNQKRLLHVSFFLPYPHEHFLDYKTFQTQVTQTCEKVMAQLTWLIPYLNKHLVMVYPDFHLRDPQKERTYARFSLLHGIYDWPQKSLKKNPFDLFQNQTDMKNLFFTGPEVFPTLGFEGETISSVNTANLAFQSALRKN